MLRDRKFYLLVPTAIGAPMIVTGMFFHQIRIAELQGWTLEWYGTCFIAYAVAQLVTGFLSGPLVDRFGALRMFPLLLLPRVSGLGILAAFDSVLVCPSYLILAGVTAGAARTVTGAMWAEVYGVAHLGSIRAMVTVFMVFSTALAPVSMCWMLDAGATVLVVAAVWIGYILFSTLLASAARRRTTSVVDR